MNQFIKETKPVTKEQEKLYEIINLNNQLSSETDHLRMLISFKVEDIAFVDSQGIAPFILRNALGHGMEILIKNQYDKINELIGSLGRLTEKKEQSEIKSTPEIKPRPEFHLTEVVPHTSYKH